VTSPNTFVSQATPAHPTHPAARAAILALVIVALVALSLSEAVHAGVLRVLGAATGIFEGHSVLGPLVFVLLAALSAMLAFFSSAVIVGPAVLAWGPIQATALLWLGWMLGGAAAYTMARLFGRPLMRSVVNTRDFDRYATKVTRETPFTAVLLLQLSVPSELPGYLLGLVRYPLHRYLTALAITELPYAVGTVLIGEGFVERRTPLLLLFGVLAVGAVWIFSRAHRNRLAR